MKLMEKKSTHGFPVLKWGKATSDQREDFELENPLVVELEEVRLHLHQSRLHLFSTDSLEETLSTKVNFNGTIWFVSAVKLYFLGHCHVHVVVRPPEPRQHSWPGNLSSSYPSPYLSFFPVKISVLHDNVSWQCLISCHHVTLSHPPVKGSVSHDMELFATAA